MSARIGDLVKLDGPTLIALRGIIAVHHDPLSKEPSKIILEGGAWILVTRMEAEFVRCEWEFWHVGVKESLHRALDAMTAARDAALDALEANALMLSPGMQWEAQRKAAELRKVGT